MPDKLARLAQWRADFPLYAKECLRIRTKAGDIEPLNLNEAQLLIHARLEEQRAEKGWVRALILKGRQQGASTLVAARFYHRTTMFPGVNTYILAHEQPASDNLFGIVDRYQRYNPLAPHVGTSNVKELVFDRLDSSYVVATAGQKAGGRSRSITLFHGSEVAFWSNAEDHFASSVQAVPLLPKTEIILESTANGIGGEFFDRWQKAEAGLNDFIAIFVPWYLTAEYSRPVPPGFEVSRDAFDGGMSESDMQELFGLSVEQLAWRRAKIEELGSVRLFQQEYPSTAQEAFVAADDEPYIAPVHVLRAQKAKCDPHGPLILGVDPAGMGGDRFAVCARRGYAVLWVKWRKKIDAEEGAAWIRGIIDEYDPARVNIDNGGGGNGAAIVSRLRALGPSYLEKVRGVNFGGTAQAKLAEPRKPGPANRRAEMWMRMKEWLEETTGAHLPSGNDTRDLPSDLSAPRKKPRANGDFLLESKEDMKKRKVRSPDLADAIALTFAQAEQFTKYTEPKPRKKFGDIDSPAQRSITEDAGSFSNHSWMI
jgi:hypothetical protein